MSIVGVAEAARRLNISPVRVRQLIRSATLTAEQLENGVYLIDSSDLDRFASQERAAHVRGFSPAVAWAAAALCDGDGAAWLSSSERSRLRARLDAARQEPRRDAASAWRSRLRRLATHTDPYRVHDDNLNELRDDHRLRLSSVYATTLVGDGLAGGSGCVWVTSGNVASEVIRDYALLRSDTRPNLTVKVSDGQWPLGPIGSRSTYRLVTAADLLNEADTRAVQAAIDLIHATLTENLWRSSRRHSQPDRQSAHATCR